MKTNRLRHRIVPVLAATCMLALVGCAEGPTIPARSWAWGVNTVLPNPDGTLADFQLLPAHREDFDLRLHFSLPEDEAVTYEVAVTTIVNDGINAVVFARIYWDHWLAVWSWSVLGEAEVTVTATGDGGYHEEQMFMVYVVDEVDASWTPPRGRPPSQEPLDEVVPPLFPTLNSCAAVESALADGDMVLYTGQCHGGGWSYYTNDAREKGHASIVIHPADAGTFVCGHRNETPTPNRNGIDLWCSVNAEWALVGEGE